jgi:hypothetical protein
LFVSTLPTSYHRVLRGNEQEGCWATC